MVLKKSRSQGELPVPTSMDVPTLQVDASTPSHGSSPSATSRVDNASFSSMRIVRLPTDYAMYWVLPMLLISIANVPLDALYNAANGQQLSTGSNRPRSHTGSSLFKMFGTSEKDINAKEKGTGMHKSASTLSLRNLFSGSPRLPKCSSFQSLTKFATEEKSYRYKLEDFEPVKQIGCVEYSGLVLHRGEAHNCCVDVMKDAHGCSPGMSCRAHTGLGRTGVYSCAGTSQQTSWWY